MLKIASGKLYGDKWSLSSAIWKNGLRTKSDIQNVVAKGLVENKPIKDIADAITKYVDPTARKPWDWSKVYPGTAAQVDYNAQRLARTMIQHSFQASLVESQRFNPFCQGIVWHSVGLHGRTCELCLERDGNVFPVKDLPLDHPNGLCYFEPAMDNMNDIADRLANWANGGSDPALDTYVAKAFNLNPKKLAGKGAVAKAKTGVNPSTKSRTKTGGKTASKAAPKKAAKSGGIEDKGAFIDENFDNLRKKVIQSQTTRKDGEAIWEALRKEMLKLEDDQLRYMSTGSDKLKAILPSPEGRAFFMPGKNTITMDIAKELSNPRGAFSTFFHEFGHLLDHNAVGKGHKYFFTFSKKFRKTLYSSLEKEYNKLLRPDGTLKKEVWKDLRYRGSGFMESNDITAGIQDIISGLSHDANRIKWGHKKSYWLRDDSLLSQETMANFNDIWRDPQKFAYMKKYFPESFKLWREQVDVYLKYKGMK